MSCSERTRQLCAEFMGGTRPRYIFGTTPYAADIAEKVRPDGFIDDFTSASHFSGVPIVKLAAVPANAIIVSGVVDGRPVSVDRLLTSRGFDHLDYFSFLKLSGLALKDRSFVPSAEFIKDYADHRSQYDHIYSLLADEESRETFECLTRFRLEQDLSLMDSFSFRPQESYFEPFVRLPAGETVFLDVGSFDGSTTLEFIRRCPDYRSIHLFEPEPGQMAAIKSKLSGLRDIHFHQCGASDKQETLKFTSSGSWSHLDEAGDIVIEVDKIASRVTEKSTLIKMDIEGHEYAALEGARQRILEDHPILAICTYHRVDDYWKLPELVFSIRQDYKLYMRHYTEGVLETVYYFVPAN